MLTNNILHVFSLRACVMENNKFVLEIGLYKYDEYYGLYSTITCLQCLRRVQTNHIWPTNMDKLLENDLPSLIVQR